MPWNTTRPRSSRYGRQHKATRAAHLAALRTAGAAVCAEARNPGSHCLHRSHLITPDMRLHLSHNSQTGEVLGLSHADCNIADGARRGRATQHHRAHTPTRQSPLRW